MSTHELHSDGRKHGPATNIWGLPLVLFCGLLGVTIALCVVYRNDAREEQRQRLEAVGYQLSLRLERIINDQFRPMRRIRRDWSLRNEPEQIRMEKVTGSVLEGLPAYKSICWVDGNGKCLAAIPSAGCEALQENIKLYPHQWAALLQRAEHSTGKEAVMTIADDQAGPILIAAFPTYRDSSTSPDGCLVGTLWLKTLMNELMASAHAGNLHVQLLDHGKQVMHIPGQISYDTSAGSEDFTIKALDQVWTLQAQIGEEIVTWRVNRPLGWFFLGGLAVSFLTALMVLQALMHRRRDMDRTQQYLKALETLHEVSAAISARLATGMAMVDRMLVEAERLMGMSMSGVVLLEKKTQLLHILSEHNIAPRKHRHYSLEEMPGVAHCIKTRQTVIIENIEHLQVPANVEMMQHSGMKSRMLMPLIVGDRVIGVMMVADDKPHQFSEVNKMLARFLAVQMAVILANHQLFEQSRKDTDTKAMLLRELNHRVKNNLAGIVGLLTAGRPQMTAKAEQWLCRVIDRINTMARAHELFAGGKNVVKLSDMVDQVIGSLSVINPEKMQVITDVAKTNVSLETNQAVNLAMVLHELCYNAIVHGLAGGGRLEIHARRTPDHALVLQVIDEGIGSSRSSDDGREGEGMGLHLVRGLVSRELDGTFTLHHRPEGGMIAEVEFPLPGQKSPVPNGDAGKPVGDKS